MATSERMSKETRTILFAIACLPVGALIDYGYLAAIGKVTRDNMIFIIFFAALFSVLMTELVAVRKILDVDRPQIFIARADDMLVPENKLESPQTIWMVLLFLAVIVLFQSWG